MRTEFPYASSNQVGVQRFLCCANEEEDIHRLQKRNNSGQDPWMVHGNGERERATTVEV